MKEHFRRYLALQKYAHKQAFEKLLAAAVSTLPPVASCMVLNGIMSVLRSSSRYSYDRDEGLFYAEEDGQSHYFYARRMGVGFYLNGIKKRALHLAETYHLPPVEFNDGDTVIDCGANYADLFAYFNAIGRKVDYHSFEPAPMEYRCVQLNAPSQHNNQVALSDSQGCKDFFLSSENADSSLIEPAAGHQNKITVSATTLDQYVRGQNIQKIKLLKLEAEGAEPEALQGAIDSLQKIEFIAVDGGPERGVTNESTMEPVTNFLINNGFQMIKVDLENRYCRALFRNKNGGSVARPAASPT